MLAMGMRNSGWETTDDGLGATDQGRLVSSFSGSWHRVPEQSSFLLSDTVPYANCRRLLLEGGISTPISLQYTVGIITTHLRASPLKILP